MSAKPFLAQNRNEFGRWIVPHLREHRFLISFAIGYSCLVAVVLVGLGLEEPASFMAGFWRFLVNSLIIVFATLALYALVVLLRDRPKTSPTLHLLKTFQNGFLARENFGRAVVASIVLALVMSSFVLFKPYVAVLHPFTFDPTFEAWDRALHFGFQPFELLQPVLGHEWITLVVHRLYYLWFPVIFCTYFWQAASTGDRHSRMQFLIAFVGCWMVVGTVMALSMSSAGPIYYDQVVTTNPHVYRDAMAYLTDVHGRHGLYMFEVKEALWAHYAGTSENGLVKGISAMPSMHVSLAFLMMLFGWRYGGIARWFYTAFFVAIFLGSIHLLWHYAVDGYVAMVATWVIWFLSGRLAKTSLKQV